MPFFEVLMWGMSFAQDPTVPFVLLEKHVSSGLHGNHPGEIRRLTFPASSMAHILSVCRSLFVSLGALKSTGGGRWTP
jgi:hypothetical protein